MDAPWRTIQSNLRSMMTQYSSSTEFKNSIRILQYQIAKLNQSDDDIILKPYYFGSDDFLEENTKDFLEKSNQREKNQQRSYWLSLYNYHLTSGILFYSREKWNQARESMEKAKKALHTFKYWNEMIEEKGFNFSKEEIESDENQIDNYLILIHSYLRNEKKVNEISRSAISRSPNYSSFWVNYIRYYQIISEEETVGRLYNESIFELGHRSIILLKGSIWPLMKMAQWNQAYQVLQFIKANHSLIANGESNIMLHHSLFLPLSDDEKYLIAVTEGDAKVKNCRGNHFQHMPETFKNSNVIRVGFFNSHFVAKHSSFFLTKHLFYYMNNNNNNNNNNNVTFELYLYFWNPQTPSKLSKRDLKSFFSNFKTVRNLTGLSEQEMASHIASDKIEILVDYNIGQSNQKLCVFCYRPSPIQIHHLGFAGTTGHPCIDYLVVDKRTAPSIESQKYFREHLIYMPYTYQANSFRDMPFPDSPNYHPLTKKEMNMKKIDGLQEEEESFVYCNYNHYAKMSFEQIDSWTHILRAVNGSIMHIIEGDSPSSTNRVINTFPEDLRSRIIPQPHLWKPSHLDRLSKCHVALDNWIYNGHTMSSDVLWAGVVLVTKYGNHGFSSRVSAGLLDALNVPELITYNVEEFEELSIQLGTNPKIYNEFRERIHQNRFKAPLFDTKKWSYWWKSGLEQLSSKFRQGLPHQNIYVTP